MRIKRFHHRVYFEPYVVEEIRELIENFTEITPTLHFLEQRTNARYGLPPVPTKEDLLNGVVFEYYRNKYGYIEKFCIRCKFDNTQDVVYVISSKGRVITGWKNCRDDQHWTLDLSLYERGNENVG